MLMLPLEMAYLVDFRAHNTRWLRFFCWSGLAAAAIVMIVFLSLGLYPYLLPPFVGICFSVFILYGTRKEQTWEEQLRYLGYFFIVALLMSIAESPFLWEPVSFEREGVYLAVPLLLLFFRLRPADMWTGYFIYSAVFTFDALVPFNTEYIPQLVLWIVLVAVEYSYYVNVMDQVLNM